jgi:GNAT superfamily N-acetyltransferase
MIIRQLDAAEAELRLPDLADLLVDAVAQGASVNFLAGFSQTDGHLFWRGQLPGVAEGSRRLFVAVEDDRLLGTVVLTFAHQPNQPHRADIGKMLVHSSARRRGLGRALLDTAEEEARRAGRTLLCLDTEEGSAGDALYRACGWTPIGTIPGYALSPDGVPAGATFFFKRVG